MDSGETTNYLGIILAVAGLFFIVVVASILMSCIKCCKKRLNKKAVPPANLVQPPPGTSLSYGSTSRKLPPRGARKPPSGGRVREIRPKGTELRQYKTDKASSSRGKHKREEGRGHDYRSYDIESISESEQQQELPQPRLSFESIPDSSGGEQGLHSSNDWHTPDEEKHHFTFNTHNFDLR